MTRVDDLTDKEKAAILLICLGTEYSAILYKHLSEEEISDLTMAITVVGRVDKDTREAVVEEFYNLCLAQQYILEGGIDYAREILYRAVGPENAENLVSQLKSELQARPFEFMRKTTPSQILNLIHNENPQTIALVLSHMQSGQSAEVISALDPELQAEIIIRIAKMGATSPDYVRRAEEVLEKKILSMGFADQTAVGGVSAVVEIINSLGRNAEKQILAILDRVDAQLADEIKSNLFVFEDIVSLPNPTIQTILKAISTADLAIALKMSTADVSSKFFDNMSKRASAMIKDDMEVMPPMRIRDIEDAQQRIVAVIRRLEDEGTITIARGDGDEMYV